MSAPASLTVSLFSLRTIYGRYLSDLLLGFVMQVAMNAVCYQQYWFQMKTETSIEESRYRGKRLSEFLFSRSGETDYPNLKWIIQVCGNSRFFRFLNSWNSKLRNIMRSLKNSRNLECFFFFFFLKEYLFYQESKF